MTLPQILVPQLNYLAIFGEVWHKERMEYSNRNSLPGLWPNFMLRLKYALLLFIKLEIEIAVKSRGTLRNLRK